ncbi:MAG: adenylyl-sulfate kinase, partial [Ruminococcus sp.]
SNETCHVKGIINAGQEVETAEKGCAVTIQLDKEVDVSRGCVLASKAKPSIGNLFRVKLLWMDDTTLVAGKNYMLKLGTKKIPAVVMNIKHKIDVNTGDEVPVDALYKNEIAECDISTSEKIVLDEFTTNPGLGSFILVDRLSHMTSACGVVSHVLRRSDNLTWHTMDVTKEQRANQKGQTPKTIWFTGLSGSGKSTLANEIEKRLFLLGKHTMTLDGDNVRLGLNKNLGFKESDRIENIRRIAEVSKLMNDAGLIVITSFVSPYARDRQRAKEIIGDDNVIEVYVSTPIEECEKRDVKGLYAKARKGDIPNFTGISAPYEVPTNADVTIDTTDKTVEEAADYVLDKIKEFL